MREQSCGVSVSYGGVHVTEDSRCGHGLSLLLKKPIVLEGWPPMWQGWKVEPSRKRGLGVKGYVPWGSTRVWGSDNFWFQCYEIFLE